MCQILKGHCYKQAAVGVVISYTPTALIFILFSCFIMLAYACFGLWGFKLLYPTVRSIAVVRLPTGTHRPSIKRLESIVSGREFGISDL